jgi:hypothetical protein
MGNAYHATKIVKLVLMRILMVVHHVTMDFISRILIAKSVKNPATLVIKMVCVLVVIIIYYYGRVHV